MNRLLDAAALAAACLLLSGAALWNGYPLVWPDTGAYIVPVNLSFRSVFYNFLIAPLTWAAGSLWPIVFFQSLVAAYLMRLILRRVFGDGSPLRFLLVTLGVAILTSLPWETGFVMADVYAALVVLALFLLAFCADGLLRGERLLVSAILLAACAVHLTHPVLGAGLLAGFAALRWATRKRPAWPSPRLLMPAVPVALSALLLIGNNAIVHHEVRYSVGGYAFVLARLIADGPAVDYLRETCPTRHYALCDYLDELPRRSDVFLWTKHSPFRKLGGFRGYRKEGREIVDGTLRHDPWRIARSAALGAFRQLRKVRAGHNLSSLLDEALPTRQIRDSFPGDFAAYANSRQGRGEVRIRPLQRLHSVVLVAAWLACAALLPRLARRGRALPALLLFTIAVAYLLNAGVSALSTLDHRYGARIAWLVPFFWMAWAAAPAASNAPDDRA